ncbi:hypothetical protein CCACVL1_22294 [Corchorus capsularis]|uniref:Homeobox domain-containing protein n=1 Tax=Corchorus capsularis TaxID=210143 RepID=A0A1R3H0F2_COCAP|nr:hypothetical protein CCACVL1_22294 [Corchorus capsularis]
MDVFNENFSEVEVGNTVESLQKFIDLQRELFHSQIDQLQKVVITQCKLTGVNPLAQEMAAGALSIKIGKRPRDLLNPKAVKYMQAIFSIKDAISKKESREISALLGVTVTQVREFFASQRTRVRKQVRLSREKALRSNARKETEEGVVPNGSDTMIPVEPVPLNSVGPVNAEEAPSCSTQDDALTDMDELDKRFVENIFTKMGKEETFSGQVKLMEWILRIQNPSVLYWFLTKGGVMILATWLSQAAVEEQTTVLCVILKVFCHLPLQKALPEHMSAVLQSVNKLRLYRFSDISNRARTLISRWSKMFARSQAAKKPNGLKSATEAQNEMLLKQSINEIMGDESWQSNIESSEGTLAISNVRKLESPQVLKLLPASTDDSSKKNILGGSHGRERRKVQLVEQPGQKMAGKSSQTTRTVPASQSRPMSADDIQKAKMRAQYMQSKYGKTGSSNGMNESKAEGPNKPSTSQASISPPVSKVQAQPAEDQKKPVILPPKTSNNLDTSLDPKQNMESKESPWEKCQKVKIPWYTPPEVKLDDLWRVGSGENSKEVDVQKNRNRRERETFYYSIQEIPFNPKEPWDREMDYDDTLTPEIPTEQPPDAECTETQVTNGEHVNSATTTLGPSSSQIGAGGGGGVAAEPDLELLAVLLKNPALVFALTSGQAGNLTSQDTVKLLDLIKAGGAGIPKDNGKKVEEKVEVSLPSPTPSSNPGTSGWKPKVVRNPFSQQSQMGNRSVGQASVGVGGAAPVAERLPQQEANGLSLAQQLAAAMSQLLPQLSQSNAMTAEKQQQSSNGAFSHHGLPSNSPSMQASASEIALTMNNLHTANTSSLTSLSAAGRPPLRVETMTSMKPVPVSMTPNAPEKLHSSYSMSPLMPTLSRPQTPPQLRPQLPHVTDPSLQTHPYSSRPLVGNIGTMSDPWRARQGLASNPYPQTNQNNYNASFGGSMQPQLRSGPPWEGNEYVGNDGFESWSPDNSPNRSSEHVPGRNYLEPRMNPGWNYRPERTWQRAYHSPILSDNSNYNIPRRWHFGHSHDHRDHQHNITKEGEKIFRLGLGADIGLAAGKALTGYLSGSTAIIADAAHSVSDVVLSGVALWSFKAAKAPKDEEHPYGHGKFETLGALGISCMLLATAGGIGWHALDILAGLFSTAPEVLDSHSLAHGHSHHHGIDMDHPILALNMTIVAICIKEGLYWITKRAGEKQNSGLMKANAWHHRADAISSVVALIGVGGSILGVKFLDPLAGLVVSGMILKAGLEAGYQSVLELVDAAIPAEQLEPINQTILQVEGVKGCHRLRGRRAGSNLYLDVHIVVDPFSSVSAAHGIGENVRHQIYKSHPEVTEVFIHIDPAYVEFSPDVIDQKGSSKRIMEQNSDISAREDNVEAIVSHVFSSKFPEKFVVERINHHMLQGKMLLEVEVSLPQDQDMMIRDAMEAAKEAEEEILNAASNIVHVKVQLRLGRPIPQFKYT